MEQKSGPVKELAEEVLKDVRRQTRRHYSSEDKIRIVLEGLRGQKSIVDALPQRGDPRLQVLWLVQGVP